MANAIVLYHGKAKTNSWARWMVGRTKRQNKNNLISVIGQTGSGKTYSAMSMCEIMSEMDGVPFDISHIVFSLSELMNLINSGKLKKGSKIIFDEPQVSISAREFQSEANKVFNFLISTFRHRNLTLFFCTPFESLLDKNTRRLFHGRFETLSINRKNNTCRLKPRYLEHSDFKPEPYRKQLIVMHENDEGNRTSDKLFYWDVGKPSEQLIIEYEKKKLEFTDNLNRNISKRLQKFEDSGKSITSEFKEDVVERKELTPKQSEVMKVLSDHNLVEAGKIIGISTPAIYKRKKYAMKKGYKLEEFKDDS